MQVFDVILEYDATIVGTIKNVAKRANQWEVEDIKSIVTIELAKRLATDFDASRGIPVKRYIGMVAHSRTLDYMRGIKRGVSYDATGADSDGGDLAPLSERLADDRAVNAFQALASAGERESLAAAFDDLGDLRDFAIDAYMEEMSVEDLAHKYGISEKTVYTRRHRVKKALMEALG